jgi:hypothetical protein
VKRADALTYSLVLPAKAGTTVQATKLTGDEESEEDEPTSEPGDAPASHTFIWWTLGAMAVAAVTLAVVFNTKD